MKINLISPISQKEYCIYDYLQGIKDIISNNKDIFWTWIVNDNSKNESTKKRIYAAQKELDCELIYMSDNGGVAPATYANKNQTMDVREYVTTMYNKVIGQMPNSDYTLIIEDDIVYKGTNPIPIMLKGFNYANNVAYVYGCTFARRLTDIFGNVQVLGLDGIRCRVKTEGYEIVLGTAFGFILHRTEVLKKYGVQCEYGQFRSFDFGYGNRMNDDGYKVVVAWEVQCRHYYKTDDGLVSYIAIDNLPTQATQKQIKEMVNIQVPRQGSPLFVRVCKEDLERFIESQGVKT